MKILMALVVFGVGCHPQWKGDPELYGVQVVLDRSVYTDPISHRSAEIESYVDAPDFKDRLKRVLEMSSRYLGFDPKDLNGLRLIIKPGEVDGGCGTTSGGYNGCYDPGSNTMTVSTGLPKPTWDTTSKRCAENMVIPHELVHYFTGDRDHTSHWFDNPKPDQTGHWASAPFTDLWLKLHHQGENGSITPGCDPTTADFYFGQWGR